MADFGRSLLPLWRLDPGALHLNHGSFGAVPREVEATQEKIRHALEREPDQFFRHYLRPALRDVSARLGQFVNASGQSIALVENATTAINTVLRAIEVKPGDEILVLDHAYNAVRLAVEDTCRRAGARMAVATIPIPVNGNTVVERVLDATNANTRLAIVDHITSPTATLMPVAEITAALKARGVRVMIDGAHAVGHVPLDVTAIGADWYTANAHKWLYTPRGTAFLYAAPDVAQMTLPLNVSHYHGLGFPDAFDYTGTRDPTAWLTLPAAIAFYERFGPDAVIGYMTGLGRDWGARIETLGAAPVAPPAMSAAMRAYILPQTRETEPLDGIGLMTDLWERDRIQVAASTFAGKLLIRLSPQIYNEPADVERLIEVLQRDGWPGR